MFDIILIGFLTYRNGVKAKQKGQNAVVWGESTPKIARVFGASVTSVNRCLHKLRGYIEESIEAAESLVAYLKKWKSYASTQ